MIRGRKIQIANITMIRPSEGRTIDFEVLRKKIKYLILKVRYYQIILVIKIIMFDGEIASYFQKHLYELLSKGIEGLIDLRDNPGGSYDQVVKIADSLLLKD